MRYGLRLEEPGDTIVEMYGRTRSSGFGAEVKRRIMLGTYVLSAGYYDAYYGTAQRVRTLIRREFDQAFADVDLIATPASPTVAFPIGERIDDPWAMYACDLLTVPVNLAGLPGISLPCGLSEGLPVGLQLIGSAFSENRILAAAHALEGAIGFDPVPAAMRGGGMSETAWEPVIGLEIHVQLNTATKMFCACENRFGAEPNTLTCPLCLGHPGVLPVINQGAVEKAIEIGLALNCGIAERSVFHRKNYFYPDSPKAYQISQYDQPICAGGPSRRGRREGRHHPRAPRGGRRQARPQRRRGRPHRRRRVLAGRLQPLWHAAGRDRDRARPAVARAGRWPSWRS